MKNQNDTYKIYNLYIKLGDLLTSDKMQRVYKLQANNKPYNKSIIKKVEKIVNKLVNFYGECPQEIQKEVQDYYKICMQ